MKKITKITYNGGNVFKFKNTRVAVGTLPDHEDYMLNKLHNIVLGV